MFTGCGGGGGPSAISSRKIMKASLAHQVSTARLQVNGQRRRRGVSGVFGAGWLRRACNRAVTGEVTFAKLCDTKKSTLRQAPYGQAPFPRKAVWVHAVVCTNPCGKECPKRTNNQLSRPRALTEGICSSASRIGGGNDKHVAT